MALSQESESKQVTKAPSLAAVHRVIVNFDRYDSQVGFRWNGCMVSITVVEGAMCSVVMYIIRQIELVRSSNRSLLGTLRN